MTTTTLIINRKAYVEGVLAGTKLIQEQLRNTFRSPEIDRVCQDVLLHLLTPEELRNEHTATKEGV